MLAIAGFTRNPPIESRRSAVCRAQEFRPKPCQEKGGKKSGNRINSNTHGFVALNKGLKNERDHKRRSLLGTKTVRREAAARDDR
jgi:hypothetical protein